MNIVNTTPHDIAVVLANGVKMIYVKSSCQLRVKSTTALVRTIDEVKIYKEFLGEPVIVDPDNRLDGTDNLLVSRVVADKLKDDPDWKKYNLYVPGNLLRDRTGNIIGCEGLIEYRRREMEIVKLTYTCDCSGHIYEWHVPGLKEPCDNGKLKERLVELGYTDSQIDQMVKEAEEVY